MKRILFITKNMACGGVERTLLNLLNNLDRDRYAVDLLLLERSGDFLELVPENVRVIEADMPEQWRAILRYSDQTLWEGIRGICKKRNYWTAIKFTALKLIDRLRAKGLKQSLLYYMCQKKIRLPSEQYDAVCDYLGYGHITTYLAAEFKNAKKFSWIHVEKMDDAFRRARSVYPKFDALFGVSPQCLTNFGNEFPEIAPERLVLLYNTILKDEICRLGAQPPSVVYPTQGRFVMVSVGRLSTQKGFDLAVDAAHILKERGRQFIWIIVGDGPERANLQARISDYGLEQEFVLHGLDNNPYAYIAIADLYVQSSRFEGFATTLSEAIVLKKPIVSTSFSGVDQQVIEGKNGVLSAFDKEALADKVEEMMDNETLRFAYGRGCAEIKLPVDQTVKILDEWFR